jgi:acetylornithine deacetylase/succinyl-diaminopimelate desuccinylase-like protein
MDSSLISRLLDLAVTIQQIPAPTFEEQRRAAFVLEKFAAEGLQQVMQDEVGNVYGCVKGEGNRKPLVVSAHLDTVFPLNTDLRVACESDKIHGPGIGDNSLGVAGLFGLLWVLRQQGVILPGDLWLVANVGEEGLGDLRGMRLVTERFGKQALAFLVVEGMALGQIYHRALGVRRYRIRVQTTGGHSWVDFGQPSAIHELSGLIERFLSIPLPTRPRTTLNVGVIKGGTTVNTIAAHASLELDLRSESVHALSELAGGVERIAEQANREGVQVTVEVIGDRPAGKIAANHPLIRLGKRNLEAQGFQANLGIGSTDANIPLSQNLPAMCLGLSHGGGAHTTGEFVLTGPVAQGLAQLVGVVKGAYQALGEG